MTVKKWTCPRCEKETTDFPAISRRDNKTEICSQCGVEQALVDYSEGEKKGKLIQTIDCTPDWLPLVRYALQWIKDAKQFEKTYRKECTDFDGAMEAYTATILDCAKGLDMMNKRNRKESEAA